MGKQQELIDIKSEQCLCDNDSIAFGFISCDRNGNEIDPEVTRDAEKLACCLACGRIFNAETGEVLGINVDPVILDNQ